MGEYDFLGGMDPGSLFSMFSGAADSGSGAGGQFTFPDFGGNDSGLWTDRLGPNGWDNGPEGGGVQGTVFPGTGKPTATGGATFPGGGMPMADMIKLAMAGMGAGQSIYGMFNRSPTEKLIEQQQKLGAQNAKMASQAGQQQLQQYQSGQLTPSQTAAADQREKQQLAQWRQYLARAGIPESSAMADITNKVHQDRLVFENQQLQQNYANSIQALGLGGNQLANQTLLNLKMNKDIADAQADVMKKIGEMAGILFPGK